MSTTRTIGSYLDQKTTQIVKNLEVRRFKAHIKAVLFAGHSFVVSAPGYTGPAEVVADSTINFGTLRRPLVFRGNDCWIEKDDTGRWRAKEYVATTKCSPVTSDVAPNVPLPVYTPPIDTNTLPWTNNFPDMAFQPLNIPMGNLAGVKMPTTLSSVYDIGDGYNGTITAATTQQMLYFTTVTRFKIVKVSAYCAESDNTIQIFATNGAYANIKIIRDALGAWSVEVNNPTTGANIVTYSCGSSNGFVKTLTGTGIVLVTPIGVLFHTQVDAGAVGINAIAYGIGGSLY
jgi:hypothetical protein